MVFFLSLVPCILPFRSKMHGFLSKSYSMPFTFQRKNMLFFLSLFPCLLPFNVSKAWSSSQVLSHAFFLPFNVSKAWSSSLVFSHAFYLSTSVKHGLLPKSCLMSFTFQLQKNMVFFLSQFFHAFYLSTAKKDGLLPKSCPMPFFTFQRQ